MMRGRRWVVAEHADTAERQQYRSIAAADLWRIASDFEVGCQDCFGVELRFDPAFGPALFAFSCTVETGDGRIGPFASVGELLDGLAVASSATGGAS